MNKEKKNIPTYSEFLAIVSEHGIAIDENQYLAFAQNQAMTTCLMEGLPCVVFLLNYQTGQYIYISEDVISVLGYSAKQMYTNGLAFLLEDIFHQADFKIYNDHVFKEIIKFYSNLPIEERKKIKYTYNFRCNRSDGQVRKLLQQSTILELDDEGKPLINYGIALDITNYKPDNRITLTISKYDDIKGFEEVAHHYFPELETIDLFSKREKEVLGLLAKGKNSKSIAEQLFITSINFI